MLSLLQDSTTFFHVSQSSVGVAQAQKTSHLDTTLLLPPLPRCRQRFAFAYQPPAIFRSCSPPRQSTPRGFEPLRAEPNGFRVHLLSGSDTVSSACTHTPCNLAYRFFFLVSHLSSHCGSHWFTVLSHLQLVSSMAKKQASQSPKNIPKHKLVGPSAQNSSVCKCGHIYREHKGNK